MIIHPDMKNKTFYHYDCRSSSRIDYITSNNEILETASVLLQSHKYLLTSVSKSRNNK